MKWWLEVSYSPEVVSAKPQFMGGDLRRRLLQEQFKQQIDARISGQIPVVRQEEETRRVQEIVTRVTGRVEVDSGMVAEQAPVRETPRRFTGKLNLPGLPLFELETRQQADYRTRRIKAIPSHTSKPLALKANFLQLLLIYACIIAISLLVTGKPGWSPIQVYTTVTWSLYLPIALVGMLGAFAGRRLKPVDFRETVNEVVIFMVPSVVRDDTLPALIGVIDSILVSAPAQIPNFLIQVVVDEGAQAFDKLKQHYSEIDPVDQKHIWYTVVPRNFETRYGTKKKARANQYAMLERRVLGLESDNIFIFHLDDDTRINPQTVMAIADFVVSKSHRYYAAQGALAFPFQLTSSWFCAMMDSVRGGDDLLRFLAALMHFNGPVFGFHGENLLLNSRIEATIGWDFGPVYVEDAYFALTFLQAYPKRATFLQSCTYGGSPETVSDMIIQRRRWSHGLFGLLADKKVEWKRKLMMGYCIVNWALGMLQHSSIVFFLALLSGKLDTSPVLPVFIYIWGFNLAYQIWMYLTGLRLNLEASQASSWKFFVYPLLIILLMPIFSFLEAYAALLGLYDFLRGSKEFRVIRKSVA